MHPYKLLLMAYLAAASLIFLSVIGTTKSCGVPVGWEEQWALILIMANSAWLGWQARGDEGVK